MHKVPKTKSFPVLFRRSSTVNLIFLVAFGRISGNLLCLIEVSPFFLGASELRAYLRENLRVT